MAADTHKREHQHDDGRQRAFDQVAHRDARGAEGPCNAVEFLHQRRQDAGHPQDRADPGRPRHGSLGNAHRSRGREGRAEHPHGEPDGHQRDQDRYRELEDRRDHAQRRQRFACDERQQQREHREQDAVEDRSTVQHRGRLGLRSAQQAHDHPGERQAARNQRQFGSRTRTQQRMGKFAKFIGREGTGHGVRIGAWREPATIAGERRASANRRTAPGRRAPTASWAADSDSAALDRMATGWPAPSGARRRCAPVLRAHNRPRDTTRCGLRRAGRRHP